MPGSIERPGARLPRRLVVWTLLRATVNITALVFLYYRIPMAHLSGAGGVGWIVGGLVAFCGLAAWQVGAVIRAEHPELRAIEALSAALPLFLLAFAAAYFVIEATQPHSFTQSLTKTDALYFTVTTFVTVGYGDITPVTQFARVVTMVQMLAGVGLVGTLLKVLVDTVKTGIKRRTGTD